MRKWSRKIAVALSIAVVVSSGGFYFFSKAASSAIPRSKVLQGAKQSLNGDTNILLLGLDSRRDNDGNPIPKEISKLLHVGPASVGGYNTNTMILIHLPAGGKSAVAISIPRDDYVSVPGYASIIFLQIFSTNLILFVIALASGYSTRTFENSKLRPKFIVQSYLDSQSKKIEDQ